MKKRKILYGVCGIGSGHTYRQLSIIEHFAHTCRMVIFAFDQSHAVLSQYFHNHKNVSVLRVAVPFYVGNKDGLDFAATARRPENRRPQHTAVNAAAMAKAEKILGKPDLVITDYEPISAQYAYAHNAPLVTIDQQSKYLVGNFPPILRGQGYLDEVMRLRMFFPNANARMACSFFNIPAKNDPTETVRIFPPVLRDSITAKRNHKKSQPSIFVYITAAREFGQSLEAIVRICAAQKNTHFHISARSASKIARPLQKPNLSFWEHGDSRFTQALKECAGIVSTAGHTLLSEAMYLGIPVYAIPKGPYEQHMNARVIHENGFGISHPALTKQKLMYFINNIPRFTKNIAEDREILLRKSGQKKIIKFIEKKLLNS